MMAPSPAPPPSSNPSPGPAPIPWINPHTPWTSAFFAPASISSPVTHKPHTASSPRSPTMFGGSSSFLPPPVSSSHPMNTTRSAVVIAVTVAAMVSFLAAAGFLYCCGRCCCRNNKSLYKNGQRDKRPLLSLSMSDFSNGSPQKSFGLVDTPVERGNSAASSSLFSISNFPSSSLNGLPVLEQQRPTSSSVMSLSPAFQTNKVLPPETNPPSSPPAAVAPSPPPPVAAAATLSQPSPPPINIPNPHPLPPPTPAAPPPPPPLLMKSGGPRPPPPPPPKGVIPPPPRPQPHSTTSNDKDAASKAKLKPLFWDKVLANPDKSMVWHQIKSGSFQIDEEMIATLFGYSAIDKRKAECNKNESSSDTSVQPLEILDPKKSQNLAILLRALNVTKEEVCDAVIEGNELSSELLRNLLKMSPTPEEELKLRLYGDDLAQLGVAERFLKALVEIPYAFKRLHALLFMGSLNEDITSMKLSYKTLEDACGELRSNRLFLKLLEAILKTGNRMNDGTYRGDAQAFKLDTLLKLADVRGTDSKTTLLHFVVQEIIHSEGMRSDRMSRESGGLSNLNTDDPLPDSALESEKYYCNLGLKVVSGMGNELENVKKAAALDADSLTNTVREISEALVKTRDFLSRDMESLGEDSGFYRSLKCFVTHAEVVVTSLMAEEKKIRDLVKKTYEYFHGNTAKEEGLKMFVIVRDFLIMVDKECKNVKQASHRMTRRGAPQMQA